MKIIKVMQKMYMTEYEVKIAEEIAMYTRIVIL